MAVISDKHMLDGLDDDLFPEELTGPQDRTPRLLSNKGRLLTSGCFPEQPFPFERGEIAARLRHSRLKEIDRCFVAGGDLRLHISAGDTGFSGFVSVTIADLRTGYGRTNTAIFPFSYGAMEMPESPGGDVMIRMGDVSLDFSRSPAARYIRCRFENFDDVRPLYINLEMKLPEAGESDNGEDFDGVYIVRPLDAKKSRFAYTAHFPCMSAGGTVVMGADRYELDAKDSRASYEWLRGVLPRRFAERQLMASGVSCGRPFGLSIARGGAMVLDGERRIMFEAPQIDVSREDPMREFRMYSPDGMLELIFTPARLEYDKKRVLLSHCERQIIFGSVSGYYISDGGIQKEYFEEIPARVCALSARW